MWPTLVELNTTKLTVELLPLPVIRAEVKIDRAREEIERKENDGKDRNFGSR